MLKLKNVTKGYMQKSGVPIWALDNVSVDFPATGMVFLLGKSGSGKSTLLNVAGGLDSYDDGEIIVKGKSSRDFSGSDFDSYRNTYIGFIFQEYNILQEFTVAKNIAIALELQGKDAGGETVNAILEEVGMQKYADRKPNQLSGGQKQRVAIARALIKDPQIIMADEPTGALDSATGKQVFETLKKLSERRLVIVVSHDRDFAETYADRIIELKDGRIMTDECKRLSPVQQISDKIKASEGTIFIEAGAKLTKDEKAFITDKLIENNNQHGVIISVDKSINDGFKKYAKMDESGAREYFSHTAAEDIKPDPDRNFSLIKSRFRFWDSFKMGASGLKVKKVRLFFTVLIAAIALTFFGVADTIAAFNPVRAMHESIQHAGDTHIGIAMQQREGDGTTNWFRPVNMTASDIGILRERFPNTQFTAAYALSFWFPFYDRGGTDWGYYLPVASAFHMQNEAQLNSFGLTLTHGRLPNAPHEIAITDYQFDALQTRGISGPDGRRISITNPQSIIGRNFAMLGEDVTVTGIIDTDFDFDRFNPLRGIGNTEGLQTWVLSQELEHVLNFGFSNALFISANSPLRDFAPEIVSFHNVTWDMLFDNDWHNQISNLGNFESIRNSDNLVLFNPGQALGANDVVITLDRLNFTAMPIFPIQLERQWIGEIWDNDLGQYVWVDEWVVMLTVANMLNNPPIVNIPVQSAAELRTHLTEQLRLLAPLRANNYSLIDRWGGRSQNLNIAGVYVDFEAMFDNPETWQWQGNRFSTAFFTPAGLQQFNMYRAFEPQFASVMASLSGNAAQDRAMIAYLMSTDYSEAFNFTIRNQFSSFFENFTFIVDAMSTVFFWVGLVFAIFASLMIMSYITISISCKKRDIGILRAIGARRSDIYKIFFNESLIITGIQWLASITLSIILVWIINSTIGGGLGINVMLLGFGIRQVALLAGIGLLVAAIASFLPTRRISKLKPIDAIQNRK